MSLWAHFNILNYLTDIIDILIVSYLIYKVIMIIRGTKAVQLAKGILLIVGVWFLSSLFHLRTLEWILNNAITYGLFAIIVIFQPELRRVLEQLGRGKLFSRGTVVEEQHKQMIESVVKAASYMSKRRIGALMSIERKTGLNDYIETGIPISGNLTSQLLINIFIPNTPLHDGAVIIRGNEVIAAACYLPLSESPFISKELGTRHRAAMGVSEVTDALTVVVSEETGGIMVTKNGEMFREISEEQLSEMLQHELNNPAPASSSFLNWRGKHHG
ncbi:diadenylate cyclase CdaA [Sporolactobacillus sp. THM19-2]|uniref:diadenylate cyclase CdaA n=1 Tax=Sporolactobacillus sp. THM19-2 TaxID=2511171 RepID=UPI0010211B80|nr:diadenylate cyclase CdaA [Sporolactobacillus sp. THM19-2]RYL88093.1 TIGR00159 family protein [Sporolactobacillus sp. THM19-2]